MRVVDAPRFALGLLLTLIAGWVAAVGFLELGGTFTSFMSGNAIRTGVHLARGEWLLLAQAGTAIGSFALGAFLAGLLFAASRYWSVPISFLAEASAVSGAAYLLASMPVPGLGIIALLSFGMGVQNHLVARGRIDNSGTTFVTGTVFRFADALARTLVSGERSGLWIAYLVVLLAFTIGSCAGAAFELEARRMALAPPAACLLLLAVLALLKELVEAWRRRLGHKR